MNMGKRWKRAVSRIAAGLALSVVMLSSTGCSDKELAEYFKDTLMESEDVQSVVGTTQSQLEAIDSVLGDYSDEERKVILDEILRKSEDKSNVYKQESASGATGKSGACARFSNVICSIDDHTPRDLMETRLKARFGEDSSADDPALLNALSASEWKAYLQELDVKCPDISSKIKGLLGDAIRVIMAG